MAFIRKRRPWTSQPQETVELDYSNVIVRSARSVLLPSLGPTDLVLPSRVITKNANCNASPSDDGIAYSSSDANSGLIFSGGWNDVVPTSSPITFFARVYVAAVGVRRVLLADWSAVGASESMAVETTAANQWRQYSQGSIRITGGVVTVGWHTIVVSQAASQSSEVWVDGVSIGSSSLASTRNNGSTAAWLDSGAYTGGIGWSTNKASLMAVCEMYADGDIAKSFHDNPWQLFAPQSIWVPVSAGGGGTATDLTGQSAAHAHSAANVALTLSTTLAIQSAAHAHSAQSLTLATTTNTSLVIANAAHAHSASSPALTTASSLAVANAVHAHAAENVSLSTTGSASLAIASAAHAHTAASVTLTTDSTLTVAGAAHAHSADTVTLDTTNAASLSIGNASHAHSASSITLATGSTTLTAQSATHAHTAQAPALSLQTWLAVADAWHVHTAGNLALTFPASGALSDAEMRQMFNWVNELALLHGLIAASPLQVTPSQRIAGHVTQDITEAAGTTAVSRIP